MALTSAEFQSYDFDRMLVLFTMTNDRTKVPCAVSTDAMDHIEGTSGTRSGQREQQFLRLRERIEQQAEQKFSKAELEGTPPGIILRGIDFRK